MEGQLSIKGQDSLNSVHQSMFFVVVVFLRKTQFANGSKVIGMTRIVAVLHKIIYIISYLF